MSSNKFSIHEIANNYDETNDYIVECKCSKDKPRASINTRKKARHKRKGMMDLKGLQKFIIQGKWDMRKLRSMTKSELLATISNTPTKHMVPWTET